LAPLTTTCTFDNGAPTVSFTTPLTAASAFAFVFAMGVGEAA
jgi:hypothetical protein